MVFLLQEDRFSKCDTCVKINGLLERVGSRADPDIMKRKQEHLKVVKWVLISSMHVHTSYLKGL